MIVYCDMQSCDGSTHTLLWENINATMKDIGVPNMNVKGSMTDNAQANWTGIWKIYGNDDMVIRVFHWLVVSVLVFFIGHPT